jgi:hypothetical protein
MELKVTRCQAGADGIATSRYVMLRWNRAAPVAHGTCG